MVLGCLGSKSGLSWGLCERPWAVLGAIQEEMGEQVGGTTPYEIAFGIRCLGATVGSKHRAPIPADAILLGCAAETVSKMAACSKN